MGIKICGAAVRKIHAHIIADLDFYQVVVFTEKIEKNGVPDLVHRLVL